MKKQYNSPILEINETVEIVTTSTPLDYNTEVETETNSGAFDL